MSDTDDIHRDIGGLLEAVNGLRRDLVKSDAKSEVHRSQVYAKLESLQETAVTLGNQAMENAIKIAAVSADVAEMKPVTEQVVQWKQRGLGALGIVGIAATAFGISVGAGWDKIMEAIRGLFGG